jgi:hypothetical protein
VTGAAALRRTRRFFSAGRGYGAPFRAQRRAAEGAVLLVRVFYAANLYLAFRHLRLWSGWLGTAAIDPLWPVAWVPLVGIEPAVHAIMTLMLVGAFAAALLPGWRPARGLAFLGLFLFHAFANSFGKINHSSHGWVLVSFLLTFLPDAGRHALSRSRGLRQHYLNAFWSAQAMLLLFYFMSGTWKALAAVEQLVRGEVHGFAPTALAMHIAHRLLQTGDESLLGAFFIEHPLLGWPPFVLTLYLQVSGLWVAFRPSLHRLWGAGHLAFHFVVYLSMSVSFHPQVLVVGILLLASPFDPGCGWRQRAADLPLVGGLRALGRRQTPESQQALDGALGSHRVGDL